MDLSVLWFVVVAVLFTGYFALEGFDFGVGMLLPVLGRDERNRRVLYNTIGPLWDGNEVWVLAAGGAMFAAFPFWYATLFSGFYLPLLLILVALIVRNLAFEYRHKRPEARWKARWDVAAILGSWVPAVLWGVAFANIVQGVPLGPLGDNPPTAYHLEYTGGLLELLNPYALLGGVVTASLFATHGAMFVALKTDGEIRHRARALAVRLGSGAAVVAVVFLVWTVAADGFRPVPVVLAVLAAAALVAGLVAARAGREGRGLALTFATVVLAVATLFTVLFPDVLPSTTDPAFSLTVANATATDATLTVMTIAAAVFAPLVVGYQAWSYWVFRKRIAVHHIPEPEQAATAGTRP
jgi:cytochrome d ubiquinol oxidase subunit II